MLSVSPSASEPELESAASLSDCTASMFTLSALKSGVFKGRLTVNGLVSIGSQLTWGVQGLVTAVMAGRLLPEKEFGFVVAANAVLFGSQCLLLGPVTNPTLRFGAISAKSLRVTYWTYCAVTAVVCSTFLLFGEPLGRLIYKDPAFFTLMKYLSIPFATTSFYAVQKIVLFARARYKTVLLMDILFSASNIVILVLLHAKAMLSSAVWFYTARSGAALIGLLPFVGLYLWRRPTPGPWHEEKFDYKEYFRHSKYSSISMLSGYAQGGVDTLAVAHFLAPLSAATYGAAKLFYTGMTMVTSGLIMVALPASSRIVASGKGGLDGFYRRALLLAYALLLPGAVVLGILTRPVLQLCFGGRYLAAAPIVRIFCLTALVLPVISITDAVANGAGWFRSACIASITGGVIGIAGSLFLTPVWGLSGAATAAVLALGGSAFAIASLTWGRLSTSGSSSALSIRTQCAATLAGEAE